MQTLIKKKTEMVILISDKVDLSTKKNYQRQRHYIIIKGITKRSIHQEDIMYKHKCTKQ